MSSLYKVFLSIIYRLNLVIIFSVSLFAYHIMVVWVFKLQNLSVGVNYIGYRGWFLTLIIYLYKTNAEHIISFDTIAFKTLLEDHLIGRNLKIQNPSISDDFMGYGYKVLTSLLYFSIISK